MFQKLISGAVQIRTGGDSEGEFGWQEMALAVVQHSDVNMPIVKLEVLTRGGVFETLYEGPLWPSEPRLAVPPILRLSKRTEDGKFPRPPLTPDAWDSQAA